MRAPDPAFTFVHCADLHLDSPFAGVQAAAPLVAETLRQATFRAFDNVVTLALEEKAAFLVIAGDVYDSAHHSLYAQIRFRDAVARAVAGGIQVFVAHGNHDPLSAWEAKLTLPAGVHRFVGEAVERVSVRRRGATVAHLFGISFPVREVRDNLARRFPQQGEAPFSVGVFHGNVGGNPQHDNYAPCSLADLSACRLDYFALGHIHAPGILREREPCVVYAGTTQGRSVREAGPRGCYVVEVGAEGLPRPRFAATDVVRWHQEQMDIGDLNSLDDLLEELANRRETRRQEAQGRGVVWRLDIRGRGPLHERLSRLDPERDLGAALREGEAAREDFVWLEAVSITTRPTLDLAQRRQMQDFLGEVLRVAERVRGEGDPTAWLRKAAEERPGYRHLHRELERLKPSDWLSVLEEAEARAVDLLVGEAE